MGNWFTAFKHVAADPLPPSVPAKSIILGNAESAENATRNPGTIENIHQKCQSVMPVTFEGLREVFNIDLSRHFKISHTVHIVPPGTLGYRFGSTYIGTKQMSPVLQSELDPNGTLHAIILHQPVKNLHCKLDCLFVGRNIETTGTLSADYMGETYTASLAVGNLNIFKGTGTFVGQYFKALQIPKGLSLGFEVAHERNPDYPGGQETVVECAARYESVPAGTISASLTHGGCKFCWHRKVGDHLQIGAAIETIVETRLAVGTLGWQVDLPKQDAVLRGMVNNQSQVAVVLQKKFESSSPFTLALSGTFNRTNNQFTLGCGLTF